MKLFERLGCKGLNRLSRSSSSFRPGEQDKMPATPINLHNREIGLHKSALGSVYGGQTVLTSDTWNYVDLWLKRNGKDHALCYWSQAREFYNASSGLSPISAPLPLYYCFLNATKALLECHGVKTKPSHGIDGKDDDTVNADLSAHTVRLIKGGVGPAISKLLKDKDDREAYSLEDVLYNLPFIHRAFVLTYPQKPELFVTINKARFVLKDNSTEAWLEMLPDPKISADQLERLLPKGFERDKGQSGLVLRTKKRLTWAAGETEIAENLARLTRYNAKLRQHLVYIRSSPTAWYLKLNLGTGDVINRSPIVMTLMAMHRLSELSRYNPIGFSNLLSTQQNWLITEFIGSAPIQFVDEIAAAITGQELAVPFVRGFR